MCGLRCVDVGAYDVHRRIEASGFWWDWYHHMYCHCHQQQGLEERESEKILFVDLVVESINTTGIGCCLLMILIYSSSSSAFIIISDLQILR